MKYNGLKDLGYELGKMYGSDLASSEFSSVDVIVPVPLHPKKERKRGYNQSDWIAEGIAKTMQKPIERHNLCRIKANETQTRKSRIERWENVQDIFIVKNVNFFTNKHVLLIDDVITTGATLEACTAKILQCENARVSIATLAVA
jgi:ComF family protein